MASRKPHVRFFTTLALMGALAGVLIWSKLRLSTNMPRSAYADPKDAQVDPAPEPETTGAPEAESPAERPEAVESEVGQSPEVRDGG